MALRKQTVDIPLTGGLNDKVSKKILQSPEFITLENVRRTEAGQLSKAYGFTNKGLNTADNTTINSPTSLTSVNNELLLLGANKAYSYSETNSEWVSKGNLTLNTISTTPLHASNEDITGVDSIIAEGIIVTVWRESSDHYYNVIDENTGNTLVDRTKLNATASATRTPRLLTITGFIFIAHTEGDDFLLRRISTTNPDSYTDYTAYASQFDSSQGFDAVGYNDKIYVVFQDVGTGAIRLAELDEEGIVTATNTLASYTLQNSDITAISVFSYDSTEYIAINGLISGGSVYAAVYSINLNSVRSPVVTGSAATATSAIIVPPTEDGGVLKVFSSTGSFMTRVDLSGTDWVTYAFNNLFYAGALASRPILYNNVWYFAVLHDSSLQPTYFIVDTELTPVSKIAYSLGGAVTDIDRPANFSSSDTTGIYSLPFLRKERIVSDNGTLYANKNPYMASIDFRLSNGNGTLPNQRSLLQSGGILYSYDGIGYSEYGFHLYPEIDSTNNLTTGGSLSDGTYLIYAVYEWTDNKGVRQLSAPSIAETVTLSGGGSAQRIQVTVDGNLWTRKQDFSDIDPVRQDISIRLYMTEDASTIPYYVAEGDNNPVGGTTTITISSLATTTEILYTQGGVLENLGAPSCSDLVEYDNRVFALGLENPNEIRYTKQRVIGEQPGFNDALNLFVPEIGGKITAGSAFDNALIVFKETSTLAIFGTGPNNLGEGATFTSAQIISSDIGCIDPRSVLQTPDGIIFKSNKGIYILTRGLELQYIGAKVESFNSANVLSAHILTDVNEIRFVTDADVTLVYNYDFKHWSITSTPGALDAVVWQNTKYLYLTSSKVLQEDATTFLNDGSYVPMKVRTAWIKLAGLQGYQRIYKMAMLGSYYTNHKFNIKHYYDYSENVQDTTTVTANSLVNTATYGDSTTYGADDFFGGSQNDEVFQLVEDCPRQKCQSISFEFTDADTGGTIGQAFSIEGLSLLVGTKSGLFKASTTRHT